MTVGNTVIDIITKKFFVMLKFKLFFKSIK